MHSFVARQPIVDRENSLFAYELLFRDSEKNIFPFVNSEVATSKIFVENELTGGINVITDNNLAFINFPTDVLITNFPNFINPTQIYIEILEDVTIDEQLVTACARLRKLGYKFALDDFDCSSKWDVLIPYVDIIKIDIQQTNILKCMQLLRNPAYKNIIWLAEKVETEVEYKQFHSLGFSYFQGYYFGKPEMIKKKKMSTSSHLIIDLIGIINAPVVDYDKVESMMLKDVSLTFKLLRYINGNVSNEITSIRHALTYLGEEEVKKYLSLLLVANLSDESNNTILHSSLRRAKFCEQIAQKKRPGKEDSKAFLVGMLSQMDVLLEQPLNTMLDLLPLHGDIKTALSVVSCDLSISLQLIKSIDNTSIKDVNRYAKHLGLDKIEIKEMYKSSDNWAKHTL